MRKTQRRNRIGMSLTASAAAVGLALLPPQLPAADKTASNRPAGAQPAKPKSKPDRAKHKRIGEASIYADRFAGQTMADGTKMDLNDDNAASKTLPLGTKAKVTNLETGQSATVTIQDRGPYVEGRIVDLSPATAKQIGLSKQQGVAQVEVVPLELPIADGKGKTKRKAGTGPEAES